MEVCEIKSTSNESDMGLRNTDAISIMCSIGGHSIVAMERTQHISGRNAKVGPPEMMLKSSDYIIC